MNNARTGLSSGIQTVSSKEQSLGFSWDLGLVPQAARSQN